LWQTTQFPEAAKKSFLALRKAFPGAGEWGRGPLAGWSVGSPAVGVVEGGRLSGLGEAAGRARVGASAPLQALERAARLNNSSINVDFLDISGILFICLTGLIALIVMPSGESFPSSLLGAMGRDWKPVCTLML
jgi:hypothetical protein